MIIAFPNRVASALSVRRLSVSGGNLAVWTAALLIGGGLAGCPDNPTPGAAGSPGISVVKVDGKSAATDGGAEVPESDVPAAAKDTGASAEPDGAAEGEGDAAAEDPFEGFPADFGTSCEHNEQCSSGYCMEGPDGPLCTAQCVTGCPDEWDCEAVGNFGSDLTYLCVPKFTPLCTPCVSPNDCGGANGACIDVPPEGKHCARKCDLSSPCPDGYLCKAFDDLTNLCVPTTGSCVCNADLLGHSRECFVENSFGLCKGQETCAGPGGWSVCDAKTPSAEVCDGVDNDCDNQVDEGTAGAPCESHNEFGTCQGQVICNGDLGLGCSAKVPALEICDAVDNDCDGKADEEGADGCVVFFEDVDKDGAGSSASSKCLCKAQGNFTAGTGGDCNDLSPTVGAGKPEVCNNQDDDCDGVVDPPGALGCVFYYLDDDEDGFGVAGDKQCLCGASGKYTATKTGDCDDSKASVFPGATEKCNDFDDNCNDVVDEPNAIWCEPYLKDQDGDGYGVTSIGKCLCKPDGFWSSLTPGDCDDQNPDIHPGGVEICDGLDNSCNDIVDEGCDKDSDGYCNALKPVVGTPFSCPLGGGDCVDWDPNIHPDAAEVCDFKDNDCDGDVDEGVSSPCGGCSPVCIMGAGPDSELPFEAGGEFFDGAGVDDNGYIVLDSSTIQLNNIWISNSGEGTVSKINTETGLEVGRYDLCSDPSRTAVDSQGDAWVACRGDAKVVKLAIFEDGCVDKNGNGTIDTSVDTDKNGQISKDEMMAPGTDECVIFTVQPDGPGGKARAMGVDKDNNAWVGMWNSQKLYRLSGETGETLQTISIPTQPYGLALDQNGIIWISGRGTNQLVRVDPATNDVQAFHPGGSYSPYGLTIDENGRIWTANCCGDHAAMRFDPANNSWAKAQVEARPRGIASNGAGFVFVANDESDKVYKIDVNSMAVVGSVSLGAGHYPIGMGVDFDGKVWAINQASSSATRIEPSDMTVMSEVPTGPSPYTYSDMTGFQQKTIVAPKGTYQHVFKGWEGSATQWMQVGLEISTPPGTSAQLRVRVAALPEELPAALWSPFFGPFPPQLPNVNLSQFGAVIGKYMEVEVQLFSGDSKTTPILKSVDIVAAELK